MKIKLPVKSHEGFTVGGNEDLHPTLKETHRIFPWEVESEGFFVSKLKKIDETEPVEKFVQQQRKIEFIKSSSSKIKNYLERLSDYFGIPIQIFGEYKYFFKSNDVSFINTSWESNHLESFNRIGSRLGTIDKHGNLLLNSLAVQVLGEVITKNIYRIESKSELVTYFNGGTIKKNFERHGQQVVMYGNYYLGTGSASKEGLKSQFPRAFRTQEIILP
jgi:NOL1/NOP2/fmu family ribosome biogenesis protein